MSSSLDDLEPYEFFQHDLDEKLKVYEKSNTLTPKEKIILNGFIEYVCFFRSLSLFEELDKQIIEMDFPNYLQSLFPDVYNQDEVKSIVYSFLE